MSTRSWGKSESFKGKIQQLGRFYLLKFSSADPKRNWKMGRRTLKLMDLKKNTLTKKQGHSLLQHPSY